MKTIILTLAIILSTQSAFSATSMKCKSTTPRVSAKIYFLASGEINEIKINGKSEWKLDAEDYQTISDPSALLGTNSFLQYLQKSSGVTNGTFTSSELKLITGKSAGRVTVEEQLEYLMDDASGIAFLSFKDANNKTVGNSLMAGWGGLFHDCK